MLLRWVNGTGNAPTVCGIQPSALLQPRLLQAIWTLVRKMMVWRQNPWGISTQHWTMHTTWLQGIPISQAHDHIAGFATSSPMAALPGKADINPVVNLPVLTHIVPNQGPDFEIKINNSILSMLVDTVVQMQWSRFIDALRQKRRNSSVLTLELRLVYIKLSEWWLPLFVYFCTCHDECEIMCTFNTPKGHGSMMTSWHLH